MPDHSKDELQPFNPQDPDYRRKLWVRVVTPDRVWYYVFWKRIALALLALAVGSWLLLAAAAWTFVKYYRGYADVSYLDLALYPIRREEYKTGLGHYYLKKGREELEKQNWIEGYGFLQAGLARVPTDVTSRRLLAYLQVRLNRGDLAITTLIDGSELATADLDYLKLLFSILLEMQEDERLITLAKKLLPPSPDAILTHQYIALQYATAHFERGRYDEAERIVREWHLDEKSLEGVILIAKCDWERGYPDLAMVHLESEVPRYPKRDELYLALVHYHRELGHAAEARRYALLRNFNDPASPGPRIDVLHTYHSTDDKPAELRELKSYFADFSGDPRALQLLAGFAVDTVQPELAARIITLARERGHPLAPFLLARIQTLIAAQSYQAALDLVQETLRTETNPNEQTTSALNSLRCLALFGLKDNSRAELMLNAFLGQASLRASDALLLAKQLRLLGTISAARAVLERAVVVNRLDQGSLAELLRIDAETGNREKLAENLPKYLVMRKPSRALLEEILLRLDQPGDAPLRDQIREALARSSTAPAP